MGIGLALVPATSPGDLRGGFAIAMLLLFSLTASFAYVREARLRHESDENATRTREALDRVYDSFLPDWTTSSAVSAHGMVSVSPDPRGFSRNWLGITTTSHDAAAGDQRKLPSWRVPQCCDELG